MVVAPFAAVIALIAARWLAGMKREGWAFILTGLAIVLTVASLFAMHLAAALEEAR